MAAYVALHGAFASPCSMPIVRKMEEAAEADLAGEYPWSAAATWCHRLSPAPRLLCLQSKAFCLVREEMILSNARSWSSLCSMRFLHNRCFPLEARFHCCACEERSQLAGSCAPGIDYALQLAPAYSISLLLDAQASVRQGQIICPDVPTCLHDR